MNGNKNGYVTANKDSGQSYARTAPVINIAVEGHVDRRTKQQIAVEAGRSTALAMRRNG